jgi:ribosome assembly protein 1
MTKFDNRSIEIESIDKQFTIRIRSLALPLEITNYLEESNHFIKLLNKFNENKLENLESEKNEIIETLKKFKNNLIQIYSQKYCNNINQSNKYDFIKIIDKIISFGPNRCGANVLVNFSDKDFKSIWNNLDRNSISKYSIFSKYEKSIVFGFNLATIKGPICAEPIQGVAFIVEDFQVKENFSDSIGADLENLKLNDNILISEREVSNINEDEPFTEKQTFELKTNQNSYLKCVNFIKEACLKSFSIQNVWLKITSL